MILLLIIFFTKFNLQRVDLKSLELRLLNALSGEFLVNLLATKKIYLSRRRDLNHCKSHCGGTEKSRKRVAILKCSPPIFRHSKRSQI